jgi:hypothetical protein
MTPWKDHNSLVTDSKEIKSNEIPAKNFSKDFKMLTEIQENTDKKLNEIRKIMQDICK